MTFAVRLATCTTLPEPDPDGLLLEQALRASNLPFEWASWDDPQVDWNNPILTVIRTTWNYSEQPAAFATWLRRIASTTKLWNPVDIVLANMHKGYLLALAERGVRTAKTTLLLGTDSPVDPFVSCDADRVVIKPAIGAGSAGAKWFTADQRDAALEHISLLQKRGDVLIQPFVASVEDYGERSIIYIDGEITHAIRKTPRFAGDSERIVGPLPIAPAERRLAQAALATVAGPLLYGRVDMANDENGEPMVMELELIEPSLFFAKSDIAARQFCEGIRKRL